MNKKKKNEKPIRPTNGKPFSKQNKKCITIQHFLLQKFANIALQAKKVKRKKSTANHVSAMILFRREKNIMYKSCRS